MKTNLANNLGHLQQDGYISSSSKRRMAKSICQMLPAASRSVKWPVLRAGVAPSWVQVTWACSKETWTYSCHYCPIFQVRGFCFACLIFIHIPTIWYVYIYVIICPYSYLSDTPHISWVIWVMKNLRIVPPNTGLIRGMIIKGSMTPPLNQRHSEILNGSYLLYAFRLEKPKLSTICSFQCPCSTRNFSNVSTFFPTFPGIFPFSYRVLRGLRLPPCMPSA